MTNEKPKKTLTEEAAYQKLAARCAVAESCLSDMRKRLARWQLPDGAEERILKRLQKEKFVDEARYAKAYVKDKFRYNHWGKKRIALELRRRGIPDSFIEDALAEVDEGESEETLLRLLRNKAQTTKGNTKFDVFVKLMRYAVGRGYPADQANRCIDKIIKLDRERFL